MMKLGKLCASFSVQGKAFYPFFMASDYTPLEYSPYYVHFHTIIGPKSRFSENRQTEPAPNLLHNHPEIFRTADRGGQVHFLQRERAVVCRQVQHRKVLAHQRDLQQPQQTKSEEDRKSGQVFRNNKVSPLPSYCK